MIKVQLRFPNDACYESVKVDMGRFKLHRVFDDEIFGFIGDVYVGIKKQSLPKGFLGE
jgi:hypothetical protein